MTIFDSIRYPVSAAPSEEELENIPADIMRKWHRSLAWNIRGRSPGEITTFLSQPQNEDLVRLLRKLIMEHNL